MMKSTVVRPDELGASEEKLWEKFQNSSFTLGYPWFSLAFVRAICHAEENGRVIVAESDGEIRAFLPYAKGDDGMAVALCGGWEMLQGLVSSNDPIDMRSVIRGAGLRGWRFKHVPAEQRPLDPYRYEGTHHTDSIYFADLRDGYDGYKQSLPKSGKKGISRASTSRRALQREMGEVTFEWNSKDLSHLSLLFDWKSNQFELVRHWWSRPSVQAFIHELAGSDSEDCSGVTSVLYAGGKPVSVTLSLRRGHILAPWIIAYDPDYSRFSPGTIEWYALIEEGASRGVEVVDFGYGDLHYKQRFGNAEYIVTGGGVWGSRLGSAARSLYRKAKYRD
jgi:CelD/BcsL family acetyltransferase involved in cellulose biosynthesis